MGEEFKVLVCDDSLLIRRKLGESIRLCYNDAQILYAKDGMEALYLYRVHSPSLVFMDIVMPGKSGIEIVQEIKRMNPRAHIVMVTSVGTKANLIKSFVAGAYDFIQKPWEQSIIERVMIRHIPIPDLKARRKKRLEAETERVEGFELTPIRWRISEED